MFLAASLALAGGVAWLFWPRSGAELEAGPAAQRAPAPRRAGASSQPDFPMAAPEKSAVPTPGPVDSEAARLAELELWVRRLERARHTLDSYRESTKYPHESRPISENPDQVRPNDPIDSKKPFAKQGQKQRPGSDTQLKVRQERIFVVGEESVHFAVSAETGSGAPLPLRVVSALAAPPPSDEAPPPEIAPVPLAFNDEGQNGDEVAGDGIFTAGFQPSKTGFAQYAGTLRASVQLRVGEEEGETFFDIIYTPVPPASFTGKVREAVVNGSLDLLLAVNVRKAGHYVVNGRVDDAAGQPFALITFNDELAAGPAEVKLQVFGKLIIDQRPAFPLALRDVDAFLLKENTFPDRELLPRLMGRVYTTKVYPETAFSSAEWESEERERYLKELTKDVKEAEQQVSAHQKP